ncbi:major facilitator superfamily domain-containing protein [Aspergillus venezuelensis]
MTTEPTSELVPAGAKESAPAPADPNLITWYGPEDPEHPKNWSKSRKWTSIIPMSLFNFLSSMSSATMAPALTSIHNDLGFSSTTLSILSLTIFLLGSAFVPLITSPLSEVFGRSFVLQSMNLLYILFNTLCGAANSPNELIAFRFLAGIGGAGPFAVTIALFTLAPLLGIVIGPIAGSFLVQYVSWRWCFYVVSIVGGATQILGLPFFRETYAPVLLQRRCKRLKSTQNPALYTEHDSASLPQLLRVSLTRPFKLIGTQPVVQVWSLYCTFLWGILYLLIATFPDIGTRLADKIYKRLCAKNGGRGLPEYRLPILVVGALLIPIGLFWYGWSARSDIHWIMPNIGAAIYSAVTLVEVLCVTGYIIDTYQKYAASAMAAIFVLRSVLAVALPLAAPSLYDNLGFDWGNTLLALVSIAIGIPAPILLWYYGPALRHRSPYARDDV